jgi:hypothetical protein
MRDILHVESSMHERRENETDKKQAYLPSQLRKVSSVSLKTTGVK